jgi:drug/metabolite transporter (DMT)-like permease
MSAAMLFMYVACFSFAYLSLAAGTGALILFGAVQLTMCIAGWRAGERFGLLAACGFVTASAGLVALVMPGVTAPAPLAAGLMAGSWGGVGCLLAARTRRRRAAGGHESTNFLYATPIALLLTCCSRARRMRTRSAWCSLSPRGAVTSGVGYVVWYAALRGLTALRAATVQLSVPPLAAFGGVLWLGETLTARLVTTSVAILGGIALVVVGRSERPRPVARTR